MQKFPFIPICQYFYHRSHDSKYSLDAFLFMRTVYVQQLAFAVADPGFPREGCQLDLESFLPENQDKNKSIRLSLRGGGTHANIATLLGYTLLFCDLR